MMDRAKPGRPLEPTALSNGSFFSASLSREPTTYKKGGTRPYEFQNVDDDDERRMRDATARLRYDPILIKRDVN